MTDEPDGLPEGFDERDLQAAEYVLGALPPPQARAIEALALSDPAVAAAIAAWESRLAPLADLVPPLQPPAMLWRRLALATGIASSMGPGLDGIIHAPPEGRRGASPRRPGLWRSATLWRTTTLAMTAIAASLALLLYQPVSTGPEPLLAALTPAGTPGATFLVRVGSDGHATVLALGTPDVPQGRSLELWALAAGSKTPVSMGLLPASGRSKLDVKFPSGTKLLVSQEPAGGSPTKLPTGPVVYAGQLEGI